MTLHEAYQILAGAYDALHFCEENEAYAEHSDSIQTAIENLERQLDEASNQQDIILTDCDFDKTQLQPISDILNKVNEKLKNESNYTYKTTTRNLVNEHINKVNQIRTTCLALADEFNSVLQEKCSETQSANSQHGEIDFADNIRIQDKEVSNLIFDFKTNVSELMLRVESGKQLAKDIDFFNEYYNDLVQRVIPKVLNSISQLTEKHQKTFYRDLLAQVTFCMPLLDKVSDLISSIEELYRQDNLKRIFLNIDQLQPAEGGVNTSSNNKNVADFHFDKLNLVQSQILAYQLLVSALMTSRKIKGSVYPNFLSRLDNHEKKVIDILNCNKIAYWAQLYLAECQTNKAAWTATQSLFKDCTKAINEKHYSKPMVNVSSSMIEICKKLDILNKTNKSSQSNPDIESHFNALDSYNNTYTQVPTLSDDFQQNQNDNIKKLTKAVNDEAAKSVLEAIIKENQDLKQSNNHLEKKRFQHKLEYIQSKPQLNRFYREICIHFEELMVAYKSIATGMLQIRQRGYKGRAGTVLVSLGKVMPGFTGVLFSLLVLQCMR